MAHKQDYISYKRECEQNQLIGYWLAENNMSWRDVNDHTRAQIKQDKKILQAIKAEYKDEWAKPQRAVWQKCWFYLRDSGKPLSPSKLKKLTNLVRRLEKRRTVTRQLLKKETHDMTVKGSPLDDSPPWE